MGSKGGGDDESRSFIPYYYIRFCKANNLEHLLLA